MNREQLIISEFERDHFEQVPGSVRSDDENLRRIGIVVEITTTIGCSEACLMSASWIPCRLADRWISTREYRNTYFRGAEQTDPKASAASSQVDAVTSRCRCFGRVYRPDRDEMCGRWRGFRCCSPRALGRRRLRLLRVRGEVRPFERRRCRSRFSCRPRDDATNRLFDHVSGTHKSSYAVQLAGTGPDTPVSPCVVGTTVTVTMAVPAADTSSTPVSVFERTWPPVTVV